MIRRHRNEIVLVLAIAALVAFWVRWAYNPVFFERHVDVFEQEYGVEVGEPGQWFSAWALGDGQAYALIGIDPTGEVIAEGIREAGYRYARAGYGWATWAVSLGQPDLVPYALALVGAVCVAGVMLVAVLMRRRLGARSWLMLANPALFIGFAGDTSEPMGILFLAIALGWASWVAAALLGVTRPTFLVGLWGEWKLLGAGVAAAVALAIYGVATFGVDGMIPSGGRIGLPVLAFVEHPSIWGLLLVLAATVTVVIGVRARDWAWVLAGLFILCFGSDVLRDPVNAWRAAGFLPVMWAFGPGYRASSELESEADRSLSVDA